MKTVVGEADQQDGENKKGAEDDMERQYHYMVERTGQFPILLRIEPEGTEKVYRSGTFEHSDSFYWIYAPELEDIVNHKELFPQYTDITDDEAERIKLHLETEYARIEEEKHVIHVDHSQKDTEKGTVLINTYTKEKTRRSFRTKELEKLLLELVEKEHMVIQKIDYCFFDYWGYRKYRTSMNREDIHVICDMPLAIDGYFSDREMDYRFMYLNDDSKVVVAMCQKGTGIDLRSVFDDETNRKADGLICG